MLIVSPGQVIPLEHPPHEYQLIPIEQDVMDVLRVAHGLEPVELLEPMYYLVR